jgi:predicted ATP-grasp superfamily ATP-dependent carboligase
LRDGPQPARLTVLVTDGGYKHSLGIIRDLGQAGHRVAVISATRFAPGFYSRLAAEHARTRSASLDPGGFIDDLMAAVRRWNVDLVIPVGYASCEAVSRAQESIRQYGAQTICPTPEQFLLGSDKWTMTQKARAAGLPVPETVLAPNAEAAIDFQRASHRAGQVVVKYRRESFGQGALYAGTVEDLRRIFRFRPTHPDRDGSANTIVQEYIPGVGCGYTALAWHGHVMREFMHRRRRESPPEGGAATAAESIHDDRLAAHGRALMKMIGWHGPGMVEFRLNETGPYFIEFNPKFWGSLDLALAAGADFPGDLCRLAAGEDLCRRPLPPYRTGQRFWWPWRGDLRRLFRRPGDCRAVLGDLFNPRARSNWRWTDPLPNLLEVGGELTHCWRHRQQERAI